MINQYQREFYHVQLFNMNNPYDSGNRMQRTVAWWINTSNTLHHSSSVGWDLGCFYWSLCLEYLQEAPDSKAPAGKQAKTAASGKQAKAAPKKGPAKGSKKK
jgi:hypothetical protein